MTVVPRPALALVLVAVVSCGRAPARERASTPLPSAVSAMDAALAETARDAARPADLPNIVTDWCLEGWRALDEGTCYLVPETDAARPKTLLVYLAGIIPPTPRSTVKENVQRVVAAAAKRAGAAALLPRGRRGIGPVDARDWWAWPTSPRDYEVHASSLIAEWHTARAKLEAAVGPFERVYLAGSSSGAYFLTALALSGAVEMDGYAAISGGSVGLARSPSDAKRKPFYVGYGESDPTNGGPKALGAYLAARGWPVRTAVHPGGHGAREVYLDEAFTFFRSAAPK